MKIGFAWHDDIHALHHPEMDETHREFIALLLCAQRASDAELPACLDRLFEHTRAHFARESEMMAACGISSRDEHEAEHARILAELEQMRSRAGSGRTAFVRAYLTEAMPDWFRTHLATMDSELAGKQGLSAKQISAALALIELHHEEIVHALGPSFRKLKFPGIEAGFLVASGK